MTTAARNSEFCGKSSGKASGHQHLRHEQQGYERDTAEYLDEHHAQQLDHRELAPSAQGEGDADGQAEHDTGNRQQYVQHEAAPVDDRDGLQSRNPLETSQQEYCQQERDNAHNRYVSYLAPRRVPRYCQAEEYRRNVRHEEDAHVHPHSLEAVGNEGQRRGHDGDGKRHPLGGPSARDSPRHSQYQRREQKADLRPPEAVLTGTRRLGVELADDELAAESPYDPPFRLAEDPSQSKPQEPYHDQNRYHGHCRVVPRAEQVGVHPAYGAHFAPGRSHDRRGACIDFFSHSLCSGDPNVTVV